ncbi:MAG: hypothetical protein IKK34_00085 [Clostridia bacterium]|nr:hypothetical protein [Clostridia bacterium]
MAIKDIIRSMTGKKENADLARKKEDANTLMTAEDFPIIPATNVDLSKYRKVPLMGLATLGAAFSTLPDAARTITRTVTTSMEMDTPVFRGLWPQGVAGRMVDRGLGFSGNITSIDGSSGIVGRMRYKLIDGGLPITTTTNTVIPFNPMTMVVAAALISIDKKLDVLQEKAEEILQFLKLEKQSKQRGNLNMLAEIMEEYKRDCNNNKMCALRVVAVQDIKRESHQDILFYQEQISRKTQEQKAIHGTQNAKGMLDALMSEFYEYQLASYLYAYTSFMEIMLQKNFESASAIAEKMAAHARKYTELYTNCRAQIANYQRTAIEAQLLGGLGNVAKTVGHKMASLPILSKGPVDEALISAGESLGKHNKEAVSKRLKAFAPLETSHMDVFIENVRQLDLIYNRPDGMITDGENLYIMEVA